MDEDDDLRPRLGEARAKIVGLRRLPPGVPELVDVRAERRRHRAPAVAERSGRDDEHALARREEVHERGLEGARARRGEEQDVVLGAADLLQPAERPEHELAEVRPAVVDDRRRAGGERLGRHGRRPRRHQVALPHAASVATTRPMTRERHQLLEGRPVRPAHRVREHARREADALGGRVGSPGRRAPAPASALELRGRCVERRPQRLAARREHARSAVAPRVRAAHLAPEQRPQILVHVAVPAGDVRRAARARRRRCARAARRAGPRAARARATSPRRRAAATRRPSPRRPGRRSSRRDRGRAGSTRRTASCRAARPPPRRARSAPGPSAARADDRPDPHGAQILRRRLVHRAGERRQRVLLPPATASRRRSFRCTDP